MTLNQVFAEMVLRATDSRLCGELIRSLKAATEEMFRSDGEQINWEADLSVCTMFQEFLAFAHTHFMSAAIDLIEEKKSVDAYKKVAAEWRLLKEIFERETGKTFLDPETASPYGEINPELLKEEPKK